MAGLTAEEQKRRRAKTQARRAMETIARAGEHPTTYGALVEQITAIPYIPQSNDLSALLCDISRRTVKEGRGMLSAVVVHAGDPDEFPGDGFYALQEELGRDITGTREDRWRREFKETVAAYAAET